MRRIVIVTVGRSDYGLMTPVLRELREAGVAAQLIVAAAHLSAQFGLSVRAIDEDGWPIAERVEMTPESDEPEALARAMGVGLIGFARAYARVKPELLVVLGDRYEMHAAALAALPSRIPVAHLHGGEVTAGAIDDALRHSITKLSHLHFVATDEARARVLQLGEEPWRVTVSGAPGLDNVRLVSPLDRPALERLLSLSLDVAPLVVTYHPVTLEYEQAERQIGELLAALESAGGPIIFTAPNADTRHAVIRHALEAFVAGHPNARLIENLGTAAYFGLMRTAAAMVGNSSSGIIEAPSFELPVVNIGTRQEGRLRAENVIDVGYDRRAIAEGLRQAAAPEFRARLRGLRNPYGDGHAAERIVRRLLDVPLDRRLVMKRFVDHDRVGAATPAPVEALR